MSFYHAIYGKGGDTPDKKISVEVTKSDLTDKSSTKTLTFIVNVGQIAILSAGVGDASDNLPFNTDNTQGWTISNNKAILGSIRGGSSQTSTDDSACLGCLIVMPTENTGSISVSRTGGGTTWIGISYIILDISAK